jgi:signal transduction histidine kinase
MPDARSALGRALYAPIVILRTRPAVATLITAVLVLVARSPDGVFVGVGALLACALCYSCGAYAPLGQGSVAVGTLVVAMQVSMGFSEFPNVEIAFPTLIPFWVGYQVGLRSTLVRHLAAQTRELADEQAVFAELSVRRERARIARELHDIVAHHLTVVVVQAGAGRMSTLGPSQRGSERLAVIRQSCDQALEEIARLLDIVHAVDGPTHGGAGRWRLLIEQARAGGVDLQISTAPAGAQLPADIDDHAYQVVREGLTNTIKHAPGAHVRVRLALDQDHLGIEVRDDGPRHAERLGGAGAGLGLVGMRERLEATGGTLEAGPDLGGGWRLHATLPVAPQTVLPPR